jgi:hypothetical protein
MLSHPVQPKIENPVEQKTYQKQQHRTSSSVTFDFVYDDELFVLEKFRGKKKQMLRRATKK